MPRAFWIHGERCNPTGTLEPLDLEYSSWADLMRRAFDVDVLACPRCGRRVRLIATVEDPDAIRAILGALAESEELVGWAPPPEPALDASHAAATGA